MSDMQAMLKKPVAEPMRKSSLPTGCTLLAASLASVLLLGAAGCSKDETESYSSESSEGVSAPASSQTSSADVKQPQGEVSTTVQEAADSVATETKQAYEAVAEEATAVKEEVTQAVEEKTAEVVEAVTPAKSGSNLYATCIGCHGAAGEGGVGPKLAGQSKADIADKLTRYKAGEQIGSMTAMMAPMAAGLSDEEIDAVSEYIAGF
jgi:cytochrome c553